MSYYGAGIYVLNLGLPSSKYEYITVFHGAPDATPVLPIVYKCVCVCVCVCMCVYLSM